MASYSFSDPTSTLVGSSLNSAINTSSSGVASNTGGGTVAEDTSNNIGSYTGAAAAPQVYRRDSAMANYEYVAQQQQQSQQVDDTVPTSFSGTIDAHHMSRGILADYLLKSQVIPTNTEQTPTGTAELNQASSGAVVSPSTEPVYSYYQSQHQQQQEPAQQQPSTTSSCMVDPLPSFLSSLPLPNAGTDTAKYAATATTATDETRTSAGSGGGGTDNNADPNNSSLLAAAAAAAAATVVATNSSTTNVAAVANNSYTDISSYSHTPTNGYGYGYSGNTPSMANQVVSGLQPANNPLDLNSYSISSLSKPLNNQASNTAMLLLGNGENANHTAEQNPNDNGNVFSVLSLPQPQSTVASGAGGGVVAQRSYSDYTTYYRTPSNTFGLGGGGGGATASNNAAAPATGYYPGSATTYHPYMRPATNAYYYAAAAQHGAARYLPYNAYPPIRHFVSPARPFKCETCDQSFSRNHDLKRHVKIHSGIKPHKCHKCGKSFGRSDALKRHSMVKRCRSLNTSSQSASSTAVVSQQQSQPQPQTVASQRLDTNVMRMPPPPPPPPPPPTITPQYPQYSSQQQQQQQPTAEILMQGSMASANNNDSSSRMFVPSSSSNSIVSGILSSRTNAI